MASVRVHVEHSIDPVEHLALVTGHSVRSTPGVCVSVDFAPGQHTAALLYLEEAVEAVKAEIVAADRDAAASSGPDAEPQTLIGSASPEPPRRPCGAPAGARCHLDCATVVEWDCAIRALRS